MELYHFGRTYLVEKIDRDVQYPKESNPSWKIRQSLNLAVFKFGAIRDSTKWIFAKDFIPANIIFQISRVHEFMILPGTDFVDPIGYAELDFFNSECDITDTLVFFWSYPFNKAFIY